MTAAPEAEKTSPTRPDDVCFLSWPRNGSFSGDARPQKRGESMSFRRTTAVLAQLALITTFVAARPEANANGGRSLIKADEMREWLAYLSSDELEGRRTFSEGLGLAAAYIAAQLK